MNRKGVCYDVGRVIAGENQRPDFHERVLRRELDIIAKDLHCTAVRICGLDVDRIVTAAETALELGLEVWLSPELWDHEPAEVLDYLADAARAAESVRERRPERVILSVGSELTMFMRGILPGNTVLDRVGNPLCLAATMLRLKTGAHNKPLNRFLAQASSVARSAFHGSITYASIPIEAVEWTPFDIVSVDYYRGKQNRSTYGERVKRYFAYGKPVVVTEVGCCTYKGAEDKGGRGFLIVDRRHPDQIKPGYVRDEELQAHEVTDMLRALAAVGVDGAFVYEFASPTLAHQADPLHDFDMATYSLVKTLPDGTTGTTYPDMPWEPKQSFRAVADLYGITNPKAQ
jgi:hypothetical protein